VLSLLIISFPRANVAGASRVEWVYRSKSSGRWCVRTALPTTLARGNEKKGE